MKFIELHSKEDILEIIKNSNNRVEVLSKLGVSPNSGPNRIQLEEYIKENEIDISHFEKPQKRVAENIFKENSFVSQSVLRRHYKKGNYSEYKCSICGINAIWQGKELSLKLDHIDGKTTNNELTNLRWVCPNCDRQLDTFGAKNKNYFNAPKYKCSKCNKIIRKNQTGLCANCYKEVHISTKMKEEGTVRFNYKFKNICPCCNKNLKAFESIKCKECFSSEQSKLYLNKLSERIPKKILKNYLKNFSKNKLKKDYNIQNSQLERLCEYYNLPYKTSEIKKYTDEEWKNL